MWNNKGFLLTPMIDLIMLLSSLFLILLCLMSPTVNTQVASVEFRNEDAKAGKGSSAFADKFVKVYVYSDGRVTIDKQLVPREQLAARLKKVSAPGISIISEENVLARDLHPVLEMANDAGIPKVEFRLNGR